MVYLLRPDKKDKVRVSFTDSAIQLQFQAQGNTVIVELEGSHADDLLEHLSRQLQQEVMQVTLPF